MAASRKIVLATFGSLGDLLPFIALSHALKREGFEPVIATSAVYREFVSREGLAFAPMRPDLDELLRRLGLDMGGLAREMSRSDAYLFRKAIFPYLRESYDDIVAASEGAAAVVAHFIAFSAKIAAEKIGLPLFEILLSPLLLYSAYDPPMSSYPAPFAREPRSRLAVGYNRALICSIMQAIALAWTPIARLRRAVGLPRRSGRALILGGPAASATIALFSQALAAPQPDRSPNLSIVGHTFHDGLRNGDSLEPELEAFLAAGEKPIVATLGSLVVHDNFEFFQATAAAARRLGKRAVLMTREEEREALRARLQDDAFFVTGYAPHSLLFPSASAIVHHGGAGTTGQALRAGVPQLVIPFLADQPDNAARLVRLGVARVLTPRRVATARIVQELATLLGGEACLLRAWAIADMVSREEGASAAARIIAEALAGGGVVGSRP